MEKRLFKYNGTVELESGERLGGVEICYHISKEYGKPNRSVEKNTVKKVIWITHALTANSNPVEWWDTIVGEGRYLDPRKYTIVCANVLGSCYGSTSPLSINPEEGKPYMLNFPKLTVRDLVTCHELLRKELGINKIDLIIGGSVGGFQAVEWSIINNGLFENMVLLACNARVTPWLSAFNESMRMALYADPSFLESHYTLQKDSDGNERAVACGGKMGLAAARSLALISYRSYTGYNTTQSEEDPETMWSSRAASYQQYQGKKLVERFDAYSYLSMVNVTDSHNVGRGRSGVANALRKVRARTICIGIDSDGLFPCREQKEMAAAIPGGEYREIGSLFGHDGFLIEWQQIVEIIREII